MKRRIQRVHFVGVAGAGMSGIAEILQLGGYSVSGSDLQRGPTVDRLRGLGIRVSLGHDASQVADAQVVVYSSAIPDGNPELRAARERHIPVIPRAEMLAELMRIRYSVAVAGSHGKTTTTSLVGDVLRSGGLDPTTIIGGLVRSLGTHSRLGSSDILIAEADESDGSFLQLIPTLVVITNIDREHLDHYQSLERLKQAFLDFANRVPFYGGCVLCLDDPNVQELLPRIGRRVRTYGLSPQADTRADQIEAEGFTMRFRALHAGRSLGSVHLRLPGLHNVRNALAAIAVGLELEVPFAAIQRALEDFEGVERRFEICGEANEILVVNDYAHHPTEIRATLAAAREGGRRRLLAVFQPHRYTRTQDLFDELASAFHDADVLVLTEIYPAGEAKIAGVEGRRLAEAVRRHGHREVHWVPEKTQLVGSVQALARAGDLVLFLGAGDIGHVPERLLAELRGGNGD